MRFPLPMLACALLIGLPAAAKTTQPATSSTPPAATGTPVFPPKVDAQYAKLGASQARMKTCLDQYHANKAKGANAGLKWIQKGGGYYSACNKRLKGA